MDAGAVPHAGRPVGGIPGHAEPGAGLARDLGPAPRPAARARRTDARLPRRDRDGWPGRLPGVTAVVAHTAAERNASTRILEKIGMKFAGEEVEDRSEEHTSELQSLRH